MVKMIMSFYIVILGATIGIIVALGMMSAPVVFHPEKIFSPAVMTHFQSGIMMTHIFERFNHFLIVVLVVVIVMEGYIQGVRKMGCLVDVLITVGVVSTSGAFLWYFTPAIQTLQRQGESIFGDPTFQSLHALSEWDFKLLMASLIMLVFARLSRFQEFVQDESSSQGCYR